LQRGTQRVSWDLRRLQQFCDKNPPPNLVLLHGEEQYIIDQAKKLIKAKALSPESMDFNLDHIQWPDRSIGELKDATETIPAFSDRRLVILENAHLIKDSDLETLDEIVSHLPEQTVLMIVAQKIDMRKKAFKSINAKGVVLEAKRPFSNQMAPWIQYIAQSQGLKIQDEAAQLLHQLVGENLQEISSEVKKIKEYLGEKSEITAQVVIDVVSSSRIESIFDLTDAIGRKDKIASLTSLAKLLENGQSEIGALVMIHRHLKILIRLKEGLQSGLAGQKLSATAGIPPFFLSKYKSQAELWDLDWLNQTVVSLQETDKALKSSPQSTSIWLENFIMQTVSA
jgi:DNA polymerase-3 subunit delta